MPNLNKRLAALEAEQAQRETEQDGPIRRALVDYVFAQPATVQATFWRVWRTRWGTAEEKAEAISMCGGVLTVTGEDRAVFQRLVDEFSGGYGRAPDPLPVGPTPAYELA